jgi:hypothetical protein
MHCMIDVLGTTVEVEEKSGFSRHQVNNQTAAIYLFLAGSIKPSTSYHNM